MRSFAIDELGSSVRTLYATLIQAKLKTRQNAKTFCMSGRGKAPVKKRVSQGQVVVRFWIRANVSELMKVVVVSRP